MVTSHKYNSKKDTYLRKGVVTTERLHAAGRRDAVVPA
jgi:hypothetical protein